MSEVKGQTIRAAVSSWVTVDVVDGLESIGGVGQVLVSSSCENGCSGETNAEC